MSIERVLLVIAYVCLGIVAGCSRGGANEKAGAVAVVHGTQGNDVTGTVAFTHVPGGVRVTADLTGLTPGPHGIHVHEKGDCSAPDGSSAGAHFNTNGTKHGSREHQSAHTGDMGNIEADASGKAHLDYVDPKLKIEGPESAVGKAVIVHEKADDLTTQPTGNSGARIACGVIGTGDANAGAGTKHD